MVWRTLVRLTACALALAVRPAWADTPEPAPEERYSLSWVRGEGAEDCPPRSELANEVTKRLGRSPFDETATRSIEIQVEHGEHGYVSRTLVRDAEGRVLGRRALVSEEATCTPLFSATALAVALLIDPEAALRSDASAPQAVARFDLGSAPAPESPAPATQSSESSRPTFTPAPLPPAPVERPVPEPRELHAGVAAEALIAFGLVPDIAPGAGLYVSGHGQRWGWAANTLYVASATASNNGAVFDVGVTAFGLAGTLDLLPRKNPRLVLELGPTVGALHTSVRSPIPTAPGDYLLFALTGGARAELEIRPVLFSLRGAALVNLVRRGLFVEGETEPVWREPPVAGFIAFGAGVSFF